jgi:EAL domain-containing protein (putative c-di-GMP-specific phosphodiesterase class I)
MPGEFVPLCEEAGLILELGKWVLGEGMRQLKRWESDPKYQDLHLSINVSPRQFMHREFESWIMEALDASGCAPQLVTLELTESLIIKSVDDVARKMQRLCELGISFALDDFGTGYSSLDKLKALPFSQLKIDQGFVRDILDDANDAAIVKAILAMSHSLGLEVVAEGVETEAQRDFLLENRCEILQGYYFGRPLPLEEWAPSIEPCGRQK